MGDAYLLGRGGNKELGVVIFIPLREVWRHKALTWALLCWVGRRGHELYLLKVGTADTI